MKKKAKVSPPTPFIVKVVSLHQFTLVAVLGSGISGSLPTRMALTDERCCTWHEPILPPPLFFSSPPSAPKNKATCMGTAGGIGKTAAERWRTVKSPKRYRRLKTLVPVVKLKKGGGRENTHFWHYLYL